MKKIITLCAVMVLLAACNKDEEDPKPAPNPTQRTVIVYMSGENDLASSGFLDDDLLEMQEGSRAIPANNRLVAFVDNVSNTQKPFIIELKDGVCDTLQQYEEDFYASDPERFASIIETIVKAYPSEEYGLVLWGHANGWLVTSDSVAQGRAAAPRQAYGADNGSNHSYGVQRWMNITQMARALKSLPHFAFIFADCCAMMNVEVAYELRQATDFLIGSPAEIPGNGAPYDVLTKDFFLQTDDFYRTIIDDYYNYYIQLYQTASYAYDPRTSYLKGYSVPLSVVDMRYVEQLASATRDLLQHPDSFQTDSVPYYFQTDMPVMYDMGCLLSRISTDEDFQRWSAALDKAVPYKVFSSRWMTIFNELKNQLLKGTFRFDEASYSGLSMFVPMSSYNFSSLYQYNTTIPSLGWYDAVGWNRFMDY
ncbi:MAG: hypothetical protein IJ612_04010 [Prevotella sp.]|nr:hypothetical protein [Prevotella sp.]